MLFLIAIAMVAYLLLHHHLAAKPSPDKRSVWRHTTHPRFDARSMRILLKAEEIEALPFKDVTSEDLFELMSHDDFNPPPIYAGFNPDSPDRRIVDLQTNEVGHDLSHRYILKS